MTDRKVLIDSISKTRDERLEICGGCEFFVKSTTQCNQCGCIMSIKAMLPDNRCPIGKW